MSYNPFAYRSIVEFQKDLKVFTNGIPCIDDISVLRQSFSIEGKTLKNRLLAQPIEGGDALDSGGPSEKTYERYETLARGGSGVIWMESISVNEEGKSTPRQLWIKEETVDGFIELVRRIHENGQPFVIAQLTHSGRNSNYNGEHLAVCAYENPLLPKEHFRIISDDELDRLCEDYIHAAELAEQAGFDAVDIRACHGYLLNELLSACNRSGRYGGSYENRTRLLKNIIRGVREKTNLLIAVRLNMTDGLPYPYGWGCDTSGRSAQDMTEPLKLVSELEKLGVRIMNITAGIGAVTPYMIRPFDAGRLPDEHPMKSIDRLLGSAKAVKDVTSEVMVTGSGFTWMRQYSANVAAGCIQEQWFDFAGFGRQWISDPEYANEILEGKPFQRTCTTCGACMALLKSGKQMRCVKNQT